MRTRTVGRRALAAATVAAGVVAAASPTGSAASSATPSGVGPSTPQVVSAAPNTQVTDTFVAPGCASCLTYRVTVRAQTAIPTAAQSAAASRDLAAAVASPPAASPAAAPAASVVGPAYQRVGHSVTALGGTVVGAAASVRKSAATNYYYATLSTTVSACAIVCAWSQTTYLHNMWFNGSQSWYAGNAWVDPWHNSTFGWSLGIDGGSFAGWQPAYAGTGEWAGSHTAFHVTFCVTWFCSTNSHMDEIHVYPNGYVNYPWS